MWAHPFLQKHQNHNQLLNNHQQKQWWNLPKKIPYNQRQRKSHNKMRADSRSKDYNHAACRNQMAEEYVPDEGTRQNPKRTNKWSGDRGSTGKRIQSNNSEKYSRSWKKNGRQIEKIQELFNKDLEELKNNQREMNNTITEMKNTLEGINSRTTGAEE